MTCALLEKNHPLINKSQEEVKGYQSLGQLFHAHQPGSLLRTRVDRQDPALVFSGLALAMFPLFGQF